MTDITSADPDDLLTFVTNTAPGRRSTQSAQRSAASLAAGVLANSPDYGVEVPALAALAARLTSMGESERFVSTIRRELLAADARTGGGHPLIADGAIRATLERAGIGTAPMPLTFEPTTMYGLPPTSGFVDDPICAANGNMIHRDTDLEFPGIAAALTLVRTYNSLLSTRPGAFGPGWTSVLDVRLGVLDDRLEVRLPDGATAAFVRTSAGWVTAGRRLLDVEHRSDGADAGWTIRADRRRSYRFDLTGALVGWRVGTASVQVVRDGDGRIADVVERVSGRSYSIDWNGDTVSALTTPDGRRVAYERDPAGRLVRAESASGHLDYEWNDGLLTSVVDADGVRPFVNTYDAGGRVISQLSPFGRTTDYRYDIDGLTVISDGAGTRQAMIHDARGNLTSVIDTDGSAMRLTYDHVDRVTSVTSRGGARWQYRFDDHTDELVERVDPDGLRSAWAYDERGRVVASTGRDGSTTTYEYDGDLVVPSRIVRPDGAVTVIAVHPALDQPSAVTDADGVTIRFEYDADGQLTSLVDALGHRRELTYDDAGRLRRVLDPTGVANELTYDDAGRVVAAARAGTTRTWSRTRAGRVWAGTEPDGSGWTARFGPHGAPVEVTDGAGGGLGLSYDLLGNIEAITAADGDVFHQHFDAVGRLVGTSDPTGATVHRDYDVDGRVVEIVDAEGRTTRREVDAFGRTVRSTDGAGGTTEWAYHSNGQIVTVTDPTGRTTMTELDAAGRIAVVVAPSGARAELRFSPAGRLVERRSPAGRSETYEYDVAGRLVTVTDPSGVRRDLVLDAAGRVVDVTVGGELRLHVEYDEHGHVVAASSPTRSVAYERDLVGRVLATVDGTGVRTEFEYDARGALASATDPAGGVTRYDRDERGRITSLTAPGGRTTTWTYDDAGRVASITDPAGVLTTLARDLDGLLVGLDRGGVGWRRTLDGAGREVERIASSGELLARRELDAAGRLLVEQIGDDIAEHFLWDDDGRLETVTGPDGGTTRIVRDADGWASALLRADGRRTGFERDGHGRIVGVVDDVAGAATPGTRPSAADAAGRLLLGPDGTAYRYDDAGRLAEIAPPAGGSTRFEYGPDGLLQTEHGEVTRRFRHDPAGRVVAIDVAGVGETTIEYDDAGRRSREIAPDGSETRFTWRGLDRLVEIVRVAPDGEQTAVTIETDGAGRPVRIGGVDVRYEPVLGHADRIGDVDVVDLGSVAWRSYDGSWGHAAAHHAAGLRLGSLTFLGARVLDAGSHQFLSADPLSVVPGTNGGASAYTYAWHDPINHADPSGLRPISQEEWTAIRTREEQGRVGQFVEAIKEDPWGSLAAGVVIVGGVVLLATPLAPVGAGILVGAGLSTGVGFATGTFDPRVAAISGIAGGVTFGAATSVTSAGAQVAIAVGVGSGQSVATQAATGQAIDWQDALVSGAVSGATSLVPVGSIAKSRPQAALGGAAVEGVGSVVEQSLTGDGSISLAEVVVSSGVGAAGEAFTFVPDHRVDVTTALPTTHTVALPAPEPIAALPAGAPVETITVFRGTGRGAELAVYDDTGLLAAGAFIDAYLGTAGDADIAASYSHSAHQHAITVWGSEADYVEAHGAFGHEIEAVSGPRSMVSVTTDLEVAEFFAGKDGIVFRADVPVDSLIDQTLDGAGESELLAPHWIEMQPLAITESGP